MKGAAGFAMAAALVLVLLLASPYWPWRALCGPLQGTPLCDSAGLFGLSWLPMHGDWVARALDGTPLRDVALLLWAGLCFAVLTLAERLWSRLASH